MLKSGTGFSYILNLLKHNNSKATEIDTYVSTKRLQQIKAHLMIYKIIIIYLRIDKTDSSQTYLP